MKKHRIIIHINFVTKDRLAEKLAKKAVLKVHSVLKHYFRNTRIKSYERLEKVS